MTSSLVCVDASLALKLVFPEPDSPLARSLWNDWRGRGATVIVPTLWGYEVTSVIRRRAHRGRLDPALEAEVFAAVHSLPVHLVHPAGFHRRAWELACRFDRPTAYDAHYLALAEIAQCPFWTADERLFNRVGSELDWVHWLGTYQPTG